MIVQYAPRREARLVLRATCVLIELRRRRLFRGQEVQRQQRRTGRGKLRRRDHLFAGRGDDEVGALSGRLRQRLGHAVLPVS